ncbi:MAG: hypothetical protein EBX90_08525 [Betaproteobacteria bacterium]|nr:hypothetical protein [Betaproteobacteria bacterium]
MMVPFKNLIIYTLVVYVKNFVFFLDVSFAKSVVRDTTLDCAMEESGTLIVVAVIESAVNAPSVFKLLAALRYKNVSLEVAPAPNSNLPVFFNANGATDEP